MEAYPWFWRISSFSGRFSWTAVTISVGFIRYVPSPTRAQTGRVRCPVPVASRTPIAAGIS